LEVIGVLHLPPLPYVGLRPAQSLEEVIGRAVSEARVLEEAGFTAVLVENFGDSPYRKRVRDPLALASMAVVVREVVRGVSVGVGVNLLRNSGLEAYSVAVAAGARFIRVNALSEVVVSDSGVLEPEAPRLRVVRANYPWVRVYADILVKHGGSLSWTTLRGTEGLKHLSPEEAIRELVLDYVERGRADALVVTGGRTGESPPLELLRTVRRWSPVPVIVGSGATPENVGELLRYSDGVIVGSYIRRDGRAGNPVDAERARRFVEAVRSAGVAPVA
jgi:membrane complex biogenesis BtpA family protein